MKLSALIRKSMLWARFIRLSVFAIPMISVTSLESQARHYPYSRLLSIAMIKYHYHTLSNCISLLRRQFLNEDFLKSKYIIVDYEDCRPIATSLDGFVACAWVCEKMKINVKIRKPNSMVWRHFENDNLINITSASTHKLQPVVRKKFFGHDVAWFGIHFISSTYGHKILSKLGINQYLKRCADRWFSDNIKENWIAVHYRGTDVAKGKNAHCQQRYRIDLDAYITYLKEVIGNQYSIFVCSDQAQFIEKMYMAFPGKVFSRDIERSYNDSALHRHDYLGLNRGIDTFNLEKDALIDLLILAKAELIYTTGSGFVDAVRYLNPKIKIISLDQRRINRGKNNLPIPRKDLYDSLCRPLK